ncbi:MAG TPA: FKBP-type peptidyl-prolyl cis-trans isomerase [Bacteroidia bacterium]|nr:FKBP-type peptidyl-prolyl cis-trans isomerase [Bacteroidia bacterium]
MIKKLSPVLALLGCVAITNISLAQTKSQAKPVSKTPAKTAAKTPAKLVFTKDPATGVEYHFYKHDKKGKMALMGDIATISLIYTTEGDSLIFDSHQKGGDAEGNVKLSVKKSFDGCLEQGITLMAVGDSAAFKINTDSLFIKSFRMRGGVPPQMKGYKNLVFKIKLVKTQTEQEAKDEQQKAQDAVKGQEQALIAKYLKDSNYHATPTADSLFVLKQTGTSTKLIQVGDSVFITYVGKLLSGKVFDQSADHPGAPFVMVAGRPTLATVYDPNMRLIHGWVEAIGMMHEGDKVTILCPSSIAYGGHAMGPLIPAYSPLVFDMEVLKVVPAKK